MGQKQWLLVKSKKSHLSKTMIKYLQTTILIIGWCFVLSLFWAYLHYFIKTKTFNPKRAREITLKRNSSLVIPSLILAPLFIALFYGLFRINLLFPIHFFSTFSSIILYGFMPAFIALLASGLLVSIATKIGREYCYWQSRPFTLVAKAYGKKSHKFLRKLIIIKTLAESWAQCLPWLFGELIVIECLFNAPGLGLDAWHLAKTRNISGLLEITIWLAAIYGMLIVICSTINKWIGRRLDGYL